MAGFEDYLKRTGYQKSFLTSDASPAGAAAATPATGSQPDLTNRLLQIMSGQLGGTLTGGEKLSALGALLKSVSRGSQTSPQDVVRGIQQQKMAEVQGALQIQELRKAAAEKAQYEALRNRLAENESDPQRKAFIMIASPRALDQMAAEQFKGADGDPYLQRLTTLGRLRQENPAAANAYEALISPPVMQGSFETGIYSVPRPIPQFNIDPALLAEMKKRKL